MASDRDILCLASLRRPEIATRLLASQERIERTFSELFGGYDLRAEDVLNDVVHVENYTGVIRVGDINFYSYCEHHFAPFFGTATVTYQPSTIITGLGKIVRLVREVHARRLQIQELMTRDIALDIERVIKARGVKVITRAKHLCICSRGPGDDTAWSEVQFACGSLKSD